MPVHDAPTDRFSDTIDRKPDGAPDACPFCHRPGIHHQTLPNGIQSHVCRCGWFRFETPDGQVEEQDRETWEA
jgi:hypothetical protein